LRQDRVEEQQRDQAAAEQPDDEQHEGGALAAHRPPDGRTPRLRARVGTLARAGPGPLGDGTRRAGAARHALTGPGLTALLPYIGPGTRTTTDTGRAAGTPRASIRIRSGGGTRAACTSIRARRTTTGIGRGTTAAATGRGRAGVAGGGVRAAGAARARGRRARERVVGAGAAPGRVGARLRDGLGRVRRLGPALPGPGPGRGRGA